MHHWKDVAPTPSDGDSDRCGVTGRDCDAVGCTRQSGVFEEFLNKVEEHIYTIAHSDLTVTISLGLALLLTVTCREAMRIDGVTHMPLDIPTLKRREKGS
jgi:hypothetical protein